MNQHTSPSRWSPDRLLADFECLELPLPTATAAPGEPETEITATLVRPVAPRAGEPAGDPGPAPTEQVRDRAVLYVHGWNDYFFQAHLARFWTEQGYAFHALDLRRYGRSWRPGQFLGYTTDLTEYFDEIDAAIDLIAADHPEIVLMGHSTGGLISALWAAQRPGELAALVLNSPWLDLQGTPLLRAVGPLVVNAIAAQTPTRVFSLNDNGFYQRMINADEGEGEWHYDLTLKSTPLAQIRAGWLKAVLAGHQQVARGLHIGVPVLVLSSTRTDFRRTWDASLAEADIVLDVDQIAERSVRLGDLVTLARVEGAMHDVVLSHPPVRKQAFALLAQWLGAYVPSASSAAKQT
ncbi:alpha/beta hydrolase [Granulicoccus phenolivorans]|uniref:alpha/beta hydrolase n=1 Tax=Granulicoccus phenolivorans TaxID=266854 RepID=UPI000401ED5E|nr:alpha/beta hydrolase [Granulicoccus phenolivorans]